MQDSYLFLLVNLFWDVFFDNRPTILYRQHENNVVGASGEGLFQKIHKLKSVLNKMYSYGEFRRQVFEVLKTDASQISETQKQEFGIFLDEKIVLQTRVFI